MMEMVDIKTDPELLRLLDEAQKLPPMTAAEREAQRRSWVIGEMLLDHPNMPREEVERIYDNIKR